MDTKIKIEKYSIEIASIFSYYLILKQIKKYKFLSQKVLNIGKGTIRKFHSMTTMRFLYFGRSFGVPHSIVEFFF